MPCTRLIALLLAAATAAGGCGHTPPPSGTEVSGARRAMPTYDHVVVVILENRSYRTIKEDAAYLAALADQGAEMTRSYGVTHPSQPNYFALFAGSTMRVRSNRCPIERRGRQLAGQLNAHGYTFAAYSEALPKVGYTGCSGSNDRYKRTRAAWVSFASFKQRQHRPFSAFPDSYHELPTVSFVVPDMCHSMHDCSTATGDRWMRRHIAPYAAWAKRHDSLLIVTFDEDDEKSGNHIYTVLVGDHVKPDDYRRRISHYTVLRTIERLYGLPPLRHAKDQRPITSIWR
jgi:hypothetical protein